MTRLLAMDCAAAACSAAVLQDGTVLAAARTAMERGHAEALMPMVARVMMAAKIGFEELDAVAATVGPGSFTGVRIGLAAARGIALAAGLPTIPVTTLEAVAAAIGPGGSPLLVVLDAKRGDLYGQWFAADGAAVDAPHAASAEALWLARPPGPGRARVAGDAAALVLAFPEAGAAAELAGPGTGPDARWVGEVALRRWTAGGTGPLKPLYLRPPDVTLPRVMGPGVALPGPAPSAEDGR